MKLVVGLGNPGLQYETTRHNVGFLAIDRLIDRWKATSARATPQEQVWTATERGEKLMLIKPQTFMNLSGRSVAPIFNFFKCEPTDLIVIHDDVDLKPLQLRIKTGGGAGGHNGLKSLDQTLGAGRNGYHRIRIGVGRPAHPGMETADYVLGQFSDPELRELDPVLDDVGAAIELILAGDVGRAMTEFNREKKSGG
jgi:PTH1 family peptidyl-tRNA hydrolase